MRKLLLHYHIHYINQQFLLLSIIILTFVSIQGLCHNHNQNLNNNNECHKNDFVRRVVLEKSYHEKSVVMNRRSLLSLFTTAITTTTTFSIRQQPALAISETVGKDPDCNDKSCLGIWDGLLADCPHNNNPMNKFGGGGGAGCVSSQDDTPGIFAEPWDYSEIDYNIAGDNNDEVIVQKIITKIKNAIITVSDKRQDQIQFILQDGRYLRVIFTDSKSQEKSIGEFYITPNDTTIQFRIGSLTTTTSINTFNTTSLRNIERAELIRKELKYLKLPVLRNRKRSLFFVESDFDTFGPGSAALGPPAEMTTGELEGRQDVDPKLKIDLLQQFPF